MINFLVLVQGILLVITVALVIATVLFFRKPTTLASLSNENRALWLLFSLGLVFITASIFGLRLAGWKDDIRKSENKLQLAQKSNHDEYQAFSTDQAT